MALLPFSNSLRALSGIFRRTAGTVIVEARLVVAFSSF